MQQGTFRVYGATKDVPTEVRGEAPVFRGESGELEYGMPESYGWYDAFQDRRTYAVTAGGMGNTWSLGVGIPFTDLNWWADFRNPARIQYDNENGPLGEFATIDPQWMEYKAQSDFRENILKNVRSQLGITERVIEEDFGENAVENALRESVSNDNFMARLGFMQDAAESRRRFEAYDASSNWSTYLSSKATSVYMNYMAVDAPSTALMLASGGIGGAAAFIPTLGRGSKLFATALNSVPLLSNGAKTLRTWGLANPGRMAAYELTTQGVFGGASGYYAWDGLRRDNENILGEYALQDDNPYAEMGLGVGLGLLGGLWSWHINFKAMSKSAAIETVAMNNVVTGLPTQASVDYASRLLISHERLLKQARSAGLDKLNPVKYQQLLDIQNAANNYGLNPHNMDAIVEIMRRENISDWADMDSLLTAGIVAEHNAGKALKERIISILDAKLGKGNYDPDNIDYVANEETISTGLRNMSLTQETTLGQPVEVMAGVLPTTEGRLAAAAVTTHRTVTLDGLIMDVIGQMKRAGTITDKDSINLYERFGDWLKTRTGGSPIDFYRWAWMRSHDMAGLRDELGMLMKFVNDTTNEEGQILAKYGFGGDDLLSDLIKKARSSVDWDTGADVPLMTRGNLLSNSAAFNSLPDAMKPIVQEIDDLLIRLGRAERDFHLTPTTTALGSPRPQLAAIIDGAKGDKKLIAKINRLLDKMERSANGDPALLDIVQKQRKFYAAQMARNELLRVRLKNGMVADEAGFFNTLIHFMGKGRQYSDGTVPLRTSGSIGGLSGVDVDAETALASMNKRLNDTINDIGQARALPTTSMQRAVNATRATIDVVTDIARIMSKIREEVAAGRTPSTSIAVGYTNLKATTPALINRLEQAMQKAGFMDASGSLNIAALSKRPPEEYFKEMVDKAKQALNNKYAGNKTSQDEALGLLDFNMPSEWNFANVNAVSKALDETFGLQAIGKILKWVYRGGSVIPGGTNRLDGSSAKLWFNPRAITNTGIDAMDSYNRILFFANLIDSPHTLRRDFGNLIDRRLFSAQQIRHFNARQANRFIVEYKNIIRSGFNIRPDDEQAVIKMLINGRIDTGATEAQRRLYGATQNFFKDFRNDIEIILRRSNYFAQTVRGGRITEETVRRAVDNTLRRMLLGDLDKGKVLLNRASIKGRMRTHMIGVINDSLVRLENGTHGIRNLNDATILAAQTRGQLREALTNEGNTRAFNSWANTTGHAQLNTILDMMSDADIRNLRTVDDFIQRARTIVIDPDNVSPDFMARLNEQIDDLFERHIDPRQGFSANNRTKLQGRSTFEFASFRAGMDDTEEQLMDDIVNLLGEYRSDSLPTMIAEFASGTAVRLRMQAQISRHIGDVNIFKVLDDTRSHLKTVARNIERSPNVRSDMTNIVKETDSTMDFLEMRMAHALGLTIETPEGAAVRSGFREAAFRLHNASIRTVAGGKFALASIFSDIPRALIDAGGRNGFITTLKDFIRAIYTREGALDDLGAALEQYTFRYAIGLDNERPMANIRVPRQLRAGPLSTFVNDTVPVGSLMQIAGEVNPLTGPVARNARNMFRPNSQRVIHPAGVEATILQAGGQERTVATGAARVMDSAIQTAEEIGDINQRAGGLQYVTALPKAITARATNREFVRNINAIIAFAKELGESNLSNLPWEQRLPAFKRMARKYGLSVYQASRLNHHGLLNVDDLVAFRNATKRKGVVRGGVYDSVHLRNELDRLYPNRGLDTDEFFRRMTTYMDEEANRTVNMASIISADPQAGYLKRFVTQFSGYVRGWQQQALLRGMQDDSILVNTFRMLLPVIAGEMVYSSLRKILAGGKNGQLSMEEAYQEEMRDLDENFNIRFLETLSKVPVGSGAQSILFSYGVNPVLNSLASDNTKTFIGDVIGGKEQAYPDSGFPGSTDLSNRYFGPSSPISETLMGGRRNAADVIPSPYNGIFNQVMNLGETFSDNPYLDNAQEWGYDIPNGYLYTMIPGRHTWQFETAMRLLGVPAKEIYNSRAARYDTGR